MNRINEIWDNLENDLSFRTGVLLRRYSPSIIPDIFVALIAPEKQRCLAILVSKSVDISRWNVLQDIRFEVIPAPNQPNHFLLLLILVDKKHKDIFSVLCEDLILSVANVPDEPTLIQDSLNRFAKWQNLFEKANLEGLTIEAQKGLFGELLFLHRLLQNSSNYLLILQSWTGPTAAARDFQQGNWAVEIKTTTAVNPQTIKISNERQLDTVLIPNLFMVHYSLESLKHTGETLNDLIESIKQLLTTQPIAEQRFSFLLFEVGYFSHHQELYKNTGYTLHQKRIYKIGLQFPRLTETTLPLGVSDVKYSISMAACEPFIITSEQLFEVVKS